MLSFLSPIEGQKFPKYLLLISPEPGHDFPDDKKKRFRRNDSSAAVVLAVGPLLVGLQLLIESDQHFPQLLGHDGPVGGLGKVVLGSSLADFAAAAVARRAGAGTRPATEVV